MYNSANVAKTIKETAKSKGISVGKLLEECGLNKNALSSMTSRGSWIQANSLAIIADYLGCSVDHLLERDAIPASTPIGNEARMMILFRQLTDEQQKLMIANAEMLCRTNPQTKVSNADLV